MSIQEIPTKTENFVEAGMSAWNSLTILIDDADDSMIYTNLSDFRDFYEVVMIKILEQTEEE